MVDARPVTLIRIEEDEVSDPNRREVLNLDLCIRDNNDAWGGCVDFKGVAVVSRYGISQGSKRVARYPHNYDLASGDDSPKSFE